MAFHLCDTATPDMRRSPSCGRVAKAACASTRRRTARCRCSRPRPAQYRRMDCCVVRDFPSTFRSPLIATDALTSAQIFFVADLLQPFDDFSVRIGFLDRDVAHRGLVGRAVPVFPAWWTGDYVARTDFLFRFAFALRPAES